MKIQFLNPAYGIDFCKSARWFCRSRGRVQRHPDYLCEAIAVLEDCGHECLFKDGAAKNISRQATAESLKDFKPDMVVIQATTPSIYSDIGYAKIAKEFLGPGCRVVMVGAHVSAESAGTLTKSQGSVDIIARREYDYTLKDIASGKKLSEIEGISYIKDGQIVNNNDRPFIEDLDGLPFPSWKHIDPYNYHDAGKLYPFITLMGGRGCFGRCSFCLFPQVMYGNRYRAKSPGRFVDEIEYDIKLYPFLKEVMFEDDTLISSSQANRIKAICDEILRRKIKIAWSANSRADLVDRDVLKTMKRSGCRMLCVGYEFGDQKSLDSVRKGTTLDRMREFTDACKGSGIRIHGCFMFGAPGETPRTAARTIEFAKSLNIDTAQFSGVCAYPGTEYYKWCAANKYLVAKDWPEWVDARLEQRTLVSLPGIDDNQINRDIDRGLKEFYLRPLQIMRIASNIRSLSDIKAKLFGLKSFFSYFGQRSKSSCQVQDQYDSSYYSKYPKNVTMTPAMKSALSALDIKTDDRVLDIGCGVGTQTNILSRFSKYVVGMDASDSGLSAAKMRFGQNAFIMGDVRRLPFGDNVFDRCLCMHVLEHIYEQPEVLNEIKRVMKADSIVVFVTPDRASIFKKLPLARTWLNDPTHVKELDEAEFRKLISDYFFIIDSSRTSTIKRFGVLNVLLNLFIKPDLFIAAIRRGAV